MIRVLVDQGRNIKSVVAKFLYLLSQSYLNDPDFAKAEFILSLTKGRASQREANSACPPKLYAKEEALQRLWRFTPLRQ
jgi:hypothetical protein